MEELLTPTPALAGGDGSNSGAVSSNSAALVDSLNNSPLPIMR